ncbi:Azurin [Luteimonas sp. 9C]|uniref:azurin n=1 Tax=Luteimonas sp. 9C TaxID=2653148 RepID=UPI0012F0F670|nr:azurin [Luteimonas sp. 9C]VXB10807.1 Azurin [Luteimonas sp. 9C]
MPNRVLRGALALLLLLPATGAFARTCDLSIGSNDAMRFDTNELRVAADCTQVRLTLRHTGRQMAAAMGHNWVLTRTADYRPVAIAGGRANLASSYLPAGDTRVIAHTKVIGGGQTTTITFPTAALTRGGDYTFFCSFPGHWNVMRGKLVFG